jgi:hypothetical protein
MERMLLLKKKGGQSLLDGLGNSHITLGEDACHLCSKNKIDFEVYDMDTTIHVSNICLIIEFGSMNFEITPEQKSRMIQKVELQHKSHIY